VWGSGSQPRWARRERPDRGQGHHPLRGVKPGQPDRYYRVGGYFGCDGLGRGQPANGNEYDCRPTTLGAFAGFPFDKLVEVN
jgi:hypothetical protein